MAGCFVQIGEVEPVIGGGLLIKLDLLFHLGASFDRSLAQAAILPDDSLPAIKSKILGAITSEAARLGYSVPAGNIILPAFQKGT